MSIAANHLDMNLTRLSPIIFLLFCFFTSGADVVSAQVNVGRLFTVTHSGDSADAAVGDGVCADADGRCTLRAAVHESNGNNAERDVIIFSLAYPAVIDLTLGELTITGNNTSIIGPGARRLFVQRFTGGGVPFRIFHVPNAGTNVVIRGLTISDGIAGVFISGGGIRIGPGASVLLADASLRNHSGGSGGAILNEGSMTISRVLMASNAANLNGGAIATTPNSTTFISNSTITANSATNGGAIYAEGLLLSANNTITHNSATMNASAIFSGPNANVRLLNTIAGTDVSLPVTSLSGTFTSLGNNIITDARTSTGFTNGVNNDQVSDNNAIDPLLGPLADNGGQTDTRALLAGSPAINNGNSCVYSGTCSITFWPNLRLSSDQRRRPRQGLGGAVDVGALESGGTFSSGSASLFGRIPGFAPLAMYYNSQAILINVVTGERRYLIINAGGALHFSNFNPDEVYVIEFRSKREAARLAPSVVAFE